MKLDKAIEILTDLQKPGFARTFSPQEAEDAQKLGLEALEREEARRDIAFSSLWGALPSETH